MTWLNRPEAISEVTLSRLRWAELLIQRFVSQYLRQIRLCWLKHARSLLRNFVLDGADRHYYCQYHHRLVLLILKISSIRTPEMLRPDCAFWRSALHAKNEKICSITYARDSDAAIKSCAKCASREHLRLIEIKTV